MRSQLLIASMLACFVAAGWHFAGNHVSHAATSISDHLDETAELSTAEGALKTTSIEEIRLGQRVVGRNPLRQETQSPSVITPENWRVVRLSMFAFGVEYDLQFLRSTDWLRQEGATVGGTIDLNLAEMGLDGPAEVVAIKSCPPIEPDDGTGRQIVTGLMAHPADNILDISITGLDEPLGVTTTHPIWSETRQQFVKAAHLEVGEHLRSETGTISQITTITPHRGPPQNVYNLEVNAEHVYQVGQSGLLVHNDCDDVVDLWKAPGANRPRPQILGELDEGFSAANYPGNGPYFATDKGIADGFEEIYGNGMQQIRIPKDKYDDLVNRGIIKPDGYYSEGSVFVPPEGIDLFNEALQNGPQNIFTP